jgi:hypothetical protein
MATPSEKLADSLKELHSIQEKNVIAIKSDMLTRTHRERLVNNGFIEEVLRGWYIATAPQAAKGDSTAWYTNYWGFCLQYLEDRFGDAWCLSPEHSLMIHAGNTRVPTQLVVRAPGGNNLPVELPIGTSLFLLKAEIPPPDERFIRDGLRLYTLPAALTRCSPNTFTQDSLEVRTGISMISNATDILRILLEGGHSVVAGRIAGAFRNAGKNRIADTIVSTMKSAGYDVRENDPFEGHSNVILPQRVRSPYEARIRLMWAQMREQVLANFPIAPGLPLNTETYMNTVDKIFVTDAYHSLSIEKYKVTPELIERVRSGLWNLADNEEDRKQRDAMATKGYLDAFKSVENSLRRILAGENAGTVVDQDHGDWYLKLFGPSVTSGILNAADLAGYRNHQVYIGNSMHTPINRDAVRDAMPVLFELLEAEPEAAVRAVLGHFIFVFIHPYMDGNGRMGRFLMNAMLASGGYPWTVIPVEQRERYMQALEDASVRQNIVPFATFLGYLVDESIKGRPVATI